MISKPTPIDPSYDIHEVTDYLNEKYGFTEKDWDEVIDKFADQLSNGAILTIERGNKLENTIVDEFAADGDESVDIYYWW